MLQMPEPDPLSIDSKGSSLWLEPQCYYVVLHARKRTLSGGVEDMKEDTSETRINSCEQGRET